MFCLFVINGKAWSDPCSSARADCLEGPLAPP